MANTIKIKRGLDINLKGRAVPTVLAAKKSDTYAVVPDSWRGIYPKVTAKAGDRVKAGSVVMTDKNRPEIRFVSPVSGVVTAVNRGERRKLLSIVVTPDRENDYEDFGKKDVSSLKAQEVKDAILAAGLWPFIKQRPYDIVASPADIPRDVFISAFHSAPLAPCFDFILKGQEEDFQTGVNALAKLTSGRVYVGVRPGAAVRPAGAEVVEIEGPHPAGNVGVQINHIKPVNKGETVWTVAPEDVILIGRLFNRGVADFSRLVALTGSEVGETGYVKAIAGCTVRSLADGRIPDFDFQNGFTGLENIRIVSGDPLTGTRVQRDGYLLAYDNQLAFLPEGDETDEFFGWATPGFGKFSVSRTFLTWLENKKKEYVIDARIRGGRRAIIMSNEYDKVFPMDIYPEYLLKAIIAFDIEKMENLGIYEVAPEDFALCEFVDTSKLEIQQIVRNGLDLLYKEMN